MGEAIYFLADASLGAFPGDVAAAKDEKLSCVLQDPSDKDRPSELRQVPKDKGHKHYPYASDGVAAFDVAVAIDRGAWYSAGTSRMVASFDSREGKRMTQESAKLSYESRSSL